MIIEGSTTTIRRITHRLPNSKLRSIPGSTGIKKKREVTGYPGDKIEADEYRTNSKNLEEQTKNSKINKLSIPQYTIKKDQGPRLILDYRS